LKIIEKKTVFPAREPLPPKEQLIYQDGKFAIEFFLIIESFFKCRR
jgi:hypothetical protein